MQLPQMADIEAELAQVAPLSNDNAWSLDQFREWFLAVVSKTALT